MKDQTEREFLASVSRRPSGPMIAIIVIAAVIVILAVLLLPLIRAAHEWRDTEHGCAPADGPAYRGVRAETILINADFAEEDDRRALTPAQTLTAGQAVYVTLSAYDAEGTLRSRRGNGFVYDEGIVVTPEHIVSGRTPDTKLTVYCGGKDVRAEVTRVNEALDVAVLSAPGCHGTRLKLASRPPSDGERLIAAGFRFWDPDDPDSEFPETYREVLPPTGKRYVITMRYAHMRMADPAAVLLAHNVPVGSGIDPVTRAENEKIRRNLAEVARRGWPRYLAVKGLAVRGQSGSMLMTAGGRIVGMYSMRFTALNRSFYTPASAIRMVLRGEDGS